MGNETTKTHSPRSAQQQSQYDTRRAYHSGSWYDGDSHRLNQILQEYLDKAEQSSVHRHHEGSLRGIIVPHAGYSYSGPTAAPVYLALQRELLKSSCPIRTILVLHPSHHEYIECCAVSGASVLETPVGNLQVDSTLRQEILFKDARMFQYMSKSVDEREHSGEMQYPYLAKVLASCSCLNSVKVLPIMCGNLTTKQENQIGTLLTEIINRPAVLTVVSTDFCHWGSRFCYQPTPSDTTIVNNILPHGQDDANSSNNDSNPNTALKISPSVPISEFIARLDRRAMDLIELQEPGFFAEYLKKTRNTICGRHPVAVWLQAVSMTTARTNNGHIQTGSTCKKCLRISFVHYEQSSAVKFMHESSVSYASAIAISNTGACQDGKGPAST